MWTISPGGWNNDYRTQLPGTGTRYTIWTVQVPPGEYELFTTWKTLSGNANNAPVSVKDGAQVLSNRTLDQTQDPDDG